MTTDNSRREDNSSEMTPQDSAMTPQDRLCVAMLTSALYDWVPLIEVDQDITRDNLANSPQEQRELALRTIRSLLDDGLMGIGELPGPGDQFPDWGLSVDEAMERVHDRFVRHHDDPVAWEFTVWLGLTDKGKQVAEAIREGSRTQRG
jgi:hypothetical protein